MPAAHRVGVSRSRIVERSIALISSAQPASASIATPSQSAVAKPKPAIAAPQTTIAAATATPWRRTCPIQPEVSAASSAPADGARVEQADDAGAGVEVVRGDRREERLRHPEDHRVRVEHERPEDHRLPDEEPPALAQRLERLAGDRRPWAAPARRAATRDQRRGRTTTTSITYVAPTPGRRDQDAAERRPDDRARRSSRSTASACEAASWSSGTRPGIIARRAGAPSDQNEVADEREHVQRPDLRLAGEGVDGEQRRRPPSARRPPTSTSRRRSSRSAIVPPIAAKSEQRHRVADREQPDLERRPGQRGRAGYGTATNVDHVPEGTRSPGRSRAAGSRATRAAGGCRSRPCAASGTGPDGRLSAAPPRGRSDLSKSLRAPKA